MDLARFDDQVDVIVRDERAEALGDAAQLEPHWNPSRKGVLLMTGPGAHGACRAPGTILRHVSVIRPTGRTGRETDHWAR
nr:hypothetical protein GCM10025730_18950 [Promicromonospora thailandica]